MCALVVLVVLLRAETERHTQEQHALGAAAAAASSTHCSSRSTVIQKCLLTVCSGLYFIISTGSVRA